MATVYVERPSNRVMLAVDQNHPGVTFTFNSSESNEERMEPYSSPCSSLRFM